MARLWLDPLFDHLMGGFFGLELRPSTLTSGNVPNGHPSAEIIRQCHGVMKLGSCFFVFV